MSSSLLCLICLEHSNFQRGLSANNKDVLACWIDIQASFGSENGKRTHVKVEKSLSIEETERCQVNFVEKQLRCCDCVSIHGDGLLQGGSRTGGFWGDDLGGLLKHLTLIQWFYSPKPGGESFFDATQETSPLSATRGL